MFEILKENFVIILFIIQMTTSSFVFHTMFQPMCSPAFSGVCYT